MKEPRLDLRVDKMAFDLYGRVGRLEGKVDFLLQAIDRLERVLLRPPPSEKPTE